MVRLIKKFWWWVPVIGFIITFSARLYAIWPLPEKVDEQQEKFNEYMMEQRTWQGQQTEIVKQNTNLLKMLTERALNDN